MCCSGKVPDHKISNLAIATGPSRLVPLVGGGGVGEAEGGTGGRALQCLVSLSLPPLPHALSLSLLKEQTFPYFAE